MKRTNSSKLAAGILTLCMLLSLLPVPAFATGETFSGIEDATVAAGAEFDALAGVSAADEENNSLQVAVTGITSTAEEYSYAYGDTAFTASDTADDTYTVSYAAYSADDTEKETPVLTAERTITVEAADPVVSDEAGEGAPVALAEAGEADAVIPDASGTAWTYSQYYVEYSGLYASNKGRYNIDLTGNGIETAQTIKYQFQFHNSEDYDIGQVKIYLPYSLYADRFGSEVAPSQIGVPQAPASYSMSDFNYTIETVNGVKQLCFTNCKYIESGTDNIIQVYYELNDMATVDGTTWSIKANIEVMGVAAADSKLGTTLTGSMDTETKLTTTSKTAFIRSGVNYYPELYTWEQVQTWTGQTGDMPADFDNYRYVVWQTTIKAVGSQPWTINISDTPSDNGIVLAQFVSRSTDEDKYSDLIASAQETGELSIPIQYLYSETYYIYTVTAYPLDSFPEDLEVKNDISVTLTGCDDKLNNVKTSEANWVWEAYEYIPKSGLNYMYKRYGTPGETYQRGTYTEDSYVDVYAEAQKQGSDLALPHKWYVGVVKQNYDLVYERMDFHLSYALIDDLQFACTNEGQYQLMTCEDYYYKDITFTNIERNANTDDLFNNTTHVMTEGEDFIVYVMTAKNPGTWQYVAVVPYADINTYSIPQSFYAEGIYEFKVEHGTSAAEGRLVASGTTVLRSDSPLLTSFIENDEVSKIQICNVAATVNIHEDGSYYGEKAGSRPTTIDMDMDAYDQAHYGCETVRDTDFVTLTSLTENNGVAKTAKMQNDPVDGKVAVTYTLSGWDGYMVYGSGATGVLAAAGITPAEDRASVVMYDLLPLGVTFDASSAVTAGSLTSIKYMTEAGSWNTAGVSVAYSVTDDYRGSGRQMVKFTVTYSGEDNTCCVFDELSGTYNWLCGYGIRFKAYYRWENYDLANAGVNVMAYATDTRIKGSGYTDDGTGVFQSVGKDAYGNSYFYDPENDGVAAEPYLLYAQAANNEDFAIATRANITKRVKADSDIYATPGKTASVALDNTYTYTIQVTNSVYDTHGLIIYDHLENAAVDRVGQESGFDADYWQGTFVSAGTAEAKAKGIDPIVYYSADREQDMDLTSDGWIPASEWTKGPSEVRSVAFDLTHAVEGGEYVLAPLASVKVTITMRAPEEMQTPAVYAYNNPAFYSYFTVGDTQTPSEPELVIGNSVSVKLHDNTSLAVEKTSVDGADAPTDEQFPFLVEIDGSAWAYKEYTLLVNGASDGGVHATDKDGILLLKAGERAVFENVPADADYTVTEQAGYNWDVDNGAVRTGTLTLGQMTEETFTNHYHSLLYFEKRIKYAQDYTPNADEFTFRLLFNGEPAANVEYRIVDRTTDYRMEPAVLETGLHTDENGSFTLTASQRAVFDVPSGTGYSFTETATHVDYTCDEPMTEGTAKGDAAIAYITNAYKYKDLYISKTLIVGDGVQEPSEYTFSFTLALNGEAAASQPYELYELQWNMDTQQNGYVKIGDEVTDETGGFTLTQYQQARITHLLAGASYTVTENTENMPENVEVSGAASVSGTLPQYAPSRTANIKNQYVLRALEVSKTLLSADGATGNEDRFEFTITVNGKPYGGQLYILTHADGTTEGVFTPGTGTFTLAGGEKALFRELKIGDAYEVTETASAAYAQISPANGAAVSGRITDATEISAAAFVNAAPDNVLYVTKAVQSDIEGLAEDSLWTYKWMKVGGKWGYYWIYGGTDFYFCIEVNGQPYKNQSFTVITTDDSGATTASAGKTDANGRFTMNAAQMAVFTSLSDGDVYRVYERSSSSWDAVDGWHSADSVYDHETGKAYDGDVYWRQVVPSGTGDVEGTIGADAPQIAEFVNEYTLTSDIDIRKMIDGDWTSSAYDMMEAYGGMATLSLRLTLHDSDGNLITGPDAVIDHDEIRGGQLTISDDGIITIVSSELGDFEDFHIRIPYGYDFKLEEVDATPKEIMGTLSATAIIDYSTYSIPVIDEEGFVITNKTGLAAGSYTQSYQIDFYNTNTTEKFRVYKEADGGSEGRDFTFTLYKSDNLIYDLGDIFNYNEDAAASYNFVPMPDEAYTVYDTATGDVVAERATDSNGRFTLKAGQYAEFTGYRCRKDDGPDGYWGEYPDKNDTIYKIAEMPYSDYVPQVTIVHSTTAREWHDWHYGESGEYVPGYYSYTTSTVSNTVLSSSGAILAGDSLTFRNTYGQSASLVVTKTVTAREGVAVPADDEFIFDLTVAGKAYANEEYTLYGSDGQQIKNMQTVNGIEAEYPWTTDTLGRFTLMAGERAVFDWVGEGKSYTVTEEPKDGYTQVSPAAGTGISDVMTASGSIAEFTNYYDENPGSEGTTLTIQKLIALPHGVSAGPDETFTFQVRIDGALYAGKPYSVYNADGTLAQKDCLTSETGRLTLAGGQHAILTNVPEDVDYEVQEILSDGSAYTPVGSTKLVGATDQQNTSAVFTNAFGGLLVSKQVNNITEQTAPAADTFEFTITLDGNALAGQTYWIYDDAFRKTGEGATDGSGRFSLRAGESALFYGLSSNASYHVAESGKRYYTQSVPVSQDGYVGTTGDTAQRLLFVNEYSRLAALEISKTVVDESGNIAASEESFTFRVTIGGTLYANKPYTVYGADGYKKAGIYQTTADGAISLLAGECAVLTGVMPGAKYSVQEIDIPKGYTAESETIAGTVAETGSAAAFINSFGETPPAAGSYTAVKSSATAGQQVKAGEKITYSITVTNTGETDLAGLRVRDYIPTYTHFISADNGGQRGAISGKQHVTWFIGSLKAGESIVVSFTVEVDTCIPNDYTIRNVAHTEVTDDPTPPPLNTPDDPDTPTNEVTHITPPGDVPKTGDSAELPIYMALLLLSLLGMTAAGMGMKKRGKKIK